MRPFLAMLILTLPVLGFNSLITEGDSLYALRSVKYDTIAMLADPVMVDRAILAYRQAFSAACDSIRRAAMEKTLQCQYFKGTYTTADDEKRRNIYNEGIALCDFALAQYPESPGLHFWAGILWGYWSEVHGLLSAGRKGVAGRIRWHAETLIAIDPAFAQGGGYRTLGAVHLNAPKIPLILGWPDKKKALSLLEKAYEMDPVNLFTKKYYAQALAEQGDKKEAVRLLEEIIRSDIVHGVLEDARVKREAEALLQALR